MTDKMIARREGNTGWMIFNNPERHNAVSLEMWLAAEKILTDFERDPQVRVIVLAGAGSKAFVSGADISKFESERASEQAVTEYNATTDRLHKKLGGLPKPTIAMIRGRISTSIGLTPIVRNASISSRICIAPSSAVNALPERPATKTQTSSTPISRSTRIPTMSTT